MNKEKKKSTLVEQHALKRLEKVEENQRKAYEKKVEIIETANEMSREISKGTKDYADSLLSNIEEALQNALKVIQENRNELK